MGLPFSETAFIVLRTVNGVLGPLASALIVLGLARDIKELRMQEKEAVCSYSFYFLSNKLFKCALFII
ncbi:hypothetical protein P3S67_005362 [Capsicum chacoense]